MSFLNTIPDSVTDLLSGRRIVLADVGASAEPPVDWQKIAPLSCYVGFEPDARDRPSENAFGFAQYHMVEKAVADSDVNEVRFFLTEYPYCSSVLKPNEDVVKHYSFTELFNVVDTAKAPATTLSDCINELKLTGIDWLKLDSQGKDLDLFLSMQDIHRSRLLALDIEPGVEQFYEGENLFVDCHSRLLQEGFWLTSMNPHTYPRIEQTTRQTLSEQEIDFSRLPGCPTAIEGTYLRTIQSFESTEPTQPEYITFWLLALVQNQLGFALDIAATMKCRFDGDSSSTLLLNQTLAFVKESLVPRRPRNWLAKSLVPPILHPIAHRIAGALRGDN